MGTPLHQDQLEAIIVSVLAVNAYGLEKAWALLPAFRVAGLTDPAKVATTDVGKVMTSLYQAGYDRGMLTEMMAGRLVSLMKCVADGNLDSMNDLVTRKDREGAEALLCTVKGIGPKVAADVWMLVTSPKKEKPRK